MCEHELPERGVSDRLLSGWTVATGAPSRLTAGSALPTTENHISLGHMDLSAGTPLPGPALATADTQLVSQE